MLAQPKKMAIINILEVLRKYSDCDHRLTQKEIQTLLEKHYGMQLDRKSIKRNLIELTEAGYDIEYDIVMRRNKNGEEEEITTNWYIENDFSDAELKVIIDSIIFSKHIPRKQSRELIFKLQSLSSGYFKTSMKNVVGNSEENISVRQLFYTVEVIDEAISKNKKISFTYNYYDVDKKLHPRRNKDNAIINYIVNPIQIVAANGNYYLIGNYDKYNNISHYRIDRITGVKMTDTDSKHRSEINGLENGLNLPKHMAEHVYMFAGESIPVKFSAKRKIVSEIIDWFGTDVTFSSIDDEEVTVSIIVNMEAFRYWALQYVRFVRVIYPKNLVDTLKNDLKEAYEKYYEEE